MNDEFLSRIKSYIPDEIEEFKAAMDQPLKRQVRLNSKKMSSAKLQEYMPELQEPSVFCENAWLVNRSYGLHPLHIEGAFYLQEPSASAVVAQLNIQPDDTVLDLCAAPGSKSTQILDKLGNGGFLVSNEIEPKRAQILLSNIERMGGENFLITNMDPKTLCQQTRECFDKILVDAPCSGEGMMKKHEAARDWSIEHVRKCAFLQKGILDEAYKALKKDGLLVYSTCTYAKEENEEQIAQFLESHEDMELLKIEADFGRSGLSTEGMDASKVRRIFPQDGGEGHFMACMRKTAGSKRNLPVLKSGKLPKEAEKFLNENGLSFSCYLIQKDKDHTQIYGMDHPFTKLAKGRIIRQGVLIGTIEKNHFKPAHALYFSLKAQQDLKKRVDTDLKEMDAFLHGEPISKEAEKGYVGLFYDDLCFGFGKSDGRIIKNHIPKGLRLLPMQHVDGFE